MIHSGTTALGDFYGAIRTSGIYNNLFIQKRATPGERSFDIVFFVFYNQGL
jgi:hypothetical protein